MAIVMPMATAIVVVSVVVVAIVIPTASIVESTGLVAPAIVVATAEDIIVTNIRGRKNRIITDTHGRRRTVFVVAYDAGTQRADRDETEDNGWGFQGSVSYADRIGLRGGIDVFKRAAHRFDLLAILLSIAVIEEETVATMHRLHSECVLDGAPILFSASRDLSGTSKHAIGVATVFAVKFFGPVKIVESATIQNDVVAAIDLGDAIDRKADELVNCHHQIKESDGHEAEPDDRSG